MQSHATGMQAGWGACEKEGGSTPVPRSSCLPGAPSLVLIQSWAHCEQGTEQAWVSPSSHVSWASLHIPCFAAEGMSLVTPQVTALEGA